MAPFLRALCLAVLTAGLVTPAIGADSSAPSQAAASGPDNYEFSGVSTVGKKTMVNLYDKTQKRSFWVEAGTTSAGVTVVSYDMQKDQITLRSDGREKVLPLRPPSAVVNGTVTVPAAPVATPAPAPTPAIAAAPAAPLSQARQEEEARMLVSDLLEIGMAQRKAYEEAQKRQASGQSGTTGNATTPAGAVPVGQAGVAAAQAGTPAQNAPVGPVAAPAQTTTPTGR